MKCHVCGAEVEIWSDEEKATCTECGVEWKKPDGDSSCLSYCEYADKCQSIIASRRT